MIWSRPRGLEQVAKLNAQSGPALVWLREDLRLADQPALAAAVASGAPILCIYVFDEESPGLRPLGGASRWWLHHSLKALEASFAAIGGRLDILRARHIRFYGRSRIAAATTAIG